MATLLWFECPHCAKPDTIKNDDFDDFYDIGDQVEVECRDCKVKLTITITDIHITCKAEQA